MRLGKGKIKFLITIFLLLLSVGLLYYYFFIKLDTNWMFWKSNGGNIDWNSIEYDDDFWPVDNIEIYGEFGEWQFKEFKPIYTGYGTTEDDLNYLTGKYLDENSKEQTVKIIVSGEGMIEWPYPESDLKYFYNDYFRDYIAIREVEKATESQNIAGLDDMRDFGYGVYYDGDDYTKALFTFEELLEKIEIGDQISLRYLVSNKSYEECRYEYNNLQKIFCVNQYLNELYENFQVSIYIGL